MQEQKSKKVVFTFGRFQPPTSGHQLLIDKVVDVANKKKAEHRIYASPGSDPKRNPLSYNNKIKYMKRMFPNANIVKNASMKNPFIVAQSLSDEGYEEVTMVVGSDRVSEMRKALNRYIDEFGFKKLTVVSAGKRDPDAEGAAGMSGTKMRKAAAEGNMRDFKKGVPKKLSKTDTEGLFKAVRRGMGIRERKILGFVEHEEYSEFNDSVNEKVYKDSGLGKWFGSGGKGGAGGGGWDRYNTKEKELVSAVMQKQRKVNQSACQKQKQQNFVRRVVKKQSQML